MKKALSITYFNNRYFVLFGVFILAIMNFYLESSIMIFIFSCVYWFFLLRTKQEENGKYHLSALGISENEWFLANYLKTIGLFFLLLGFYSMLDLMIPLKAPLFVEIFFQFLPYFFLLYLLEAFNIYSMQRNRRDIPSILVLVMISAFYLIIVLSFLDKVFFPMEKYAMIITAYFIYLAFLFNFFIRLQKTKDLACETKQESYFVGVHIQDKHRFIRSVLEKERAVLITADQVHFKGMKIGDVTKFFDRNYSQFDLTDFEEAISFYSLPSDKKIGKWSLGMKKRMFISVYEASDSDVFIFDKIDQGLDPFILQKALKRIQNKAYERGERIYVLNPSSVWEDILDEEIFFDEGVVNENR